jgi:predicted site-specific integrase-resolvase
MKAKEVMKKIDISRNTLSNWVKKGYIKVEKTLSGRYIYIVEENKDSDDNTVRDTPYYLKSN